LHAILLCVQSAFAVANQLYAMTLGPASILRPAIVGAGPTTAEAPHDATLDCLRQISRSVNKRTRKVLVSTVFISTPRTRRLYRAVHASGTLAVLIDDDVATRPNKEYTCASQRVEYSGITACTDGDDSM
jgi:hypothetical protein